MLNDTAVPCVHCGDLRSYYRLYRLQLYVQLRRTMTTQAVRRLRCCVLLEHRGGQLNLAGGHWRPRASVRRKEPRRGSKAQRAPCDCRWHVWVVSMTAPRVPCMSRRALEAAGLSAPQRAPRWQQNTASALRLHMACLMGRQHDGTAGAVHEKVGTGGRGPVGAVMCACRCSEG